MLSRTLKVSFTDDDKVNSSPRRTSEVERSSSSQCMNLIAPSPWRAASWKIGPPEWSRLAAAAPQNSVWLPRLVRGFRRVARSRGFQRGERVSCYGLGESGGTCFSLFSYSPTPGISRTTTRVGCVIFRTNQSVIKNSFHDDRMCSERTEAGCRLPRYMILQTARWS